MKISILMLSYNAPKYVYESILTSRKVTKTNIPFELIVVDNDSRWPTRRLVQHLYKKGLIDKLCLNDENQLFAKGNNTASTLAADDSTHYLLLNSDVHIYDPKWLDKLVELLPEEGGISSFGAVLTDPVRADGYCMLIDRNLYDKYKLDEDFQWWWSVTKLEAQVLKDGHGINAVRNHENIIHHYGGKSGKGFKNAKNMNVDMEMVKGWFEEGSDRMVVIDRIE